MYLPGHLALGYFAAILTGKETGNRHRLLIVWFFSMLPDVDLLLPFMSHWGATHSLATALALTALTLYRRDLLPYAAAYASHILVGDLVTGGSPLLWLLTDDYLGFSLLTMPSMPEMAVEFLLFAAMIRSHRFKEDWQRKGNNTGDPAMNYASPSMVTLASTSSRPFSLRAGGLACMRYEHVSPRGQQSASCCRVLYHGS